MSAVPARGRARLSAAERRERLLAAALATFARDGYHAASIGSIAAAAGVSKPVVYDHFPSKIALYEAVVERETTRLLERGAAVAQLPPEQLEDRLRESITAVLSHLRAHPDARRVLFADPAGDPALLQVHERVRAAARASIAALLEVDPYFGPPPGMSRRLAIEFRAELTLACTEALATWWSHRPSVPLRQVVAAYMEFVWMGAAALKQGEHWSPPPRPRASDSPSGRTAAGRRQAPRRR